MSVLERFCFVTEYYDSYATIVRKFQLFFYPKDNSIEIYDIKNKKIFLKRCVVPGVSFKDLYLGNDINIYSRLHKLVEYGDDYTKNYFEEIRSNTFGLIKPDAYLNIGKIIDFIYQNGFNISRLKLCKLSLEDASLFYNNIQNQPLFQPMINFISSDYVVGMDLVKKNAIKDWLNVIGPEDVDIAKNNNPNSLRAVFGTDKIKNAIHGSLTSSDAKRESSLIFNKIRHQPILNNNSCVVIKPHAISEGNAGKIIDILLTEGFEISSMEMLYIDKVQAEEFFEIYKGVLPEYSQMIDSVVCGPIIAIEVRQNDCVNKMRALAGPHDPDIAKALRPNTIRAKFGNNCVYNAIHCTDLEEDAVIECDYLFNKVSSFKFNE
jgi:nucleoside-diphosphate kinase